jgi:hypothetical protein
MTDNDNAGAAAAGQTEVRKRFRSEIEFPYADLESAVELAKVIHDKAGTSCEVDELAAWMGQSPTGGTFRSRLGAARLFGLIETGQGRVTLTQSGREALDGTGKERSTRVAAFLNVPLFQAMYDHHKGNALPPPPAIERQMEQLGVSPKQKQRARQTFATSAQYSGFIDPSTGRFVKPGIAQQEEIPPVNQREERTGNNGNDGDGTGLSLDPLLIALLKKIPNSGSDWPGAQRVRWFRTFAMNVSQIYDADDDPVEMKIELDTQGDA